MEIELGAGDWRAGTIMISLSIQNLRCFHFPGGVPWSATYKVVVQVQYVFGKLGSLDLLTSKKVPLY